MSKDKDPLIDILEKDESESLFWIATCLYLLCTTYSLFEFILILRNGPWKQQILSIQSRVVFLCGSSSLARLLLHVYYTDIINEAGCFWASFTASFVDSYLHFLVYSMVLLYFTQTFLLTKDQESTYKRYALPAFFVFVFCLIVFLVVGRGIPCSSSPSIVLGIRSTLEFSSIIAGLNMLYLIAGIVVFMLVRSLRNTILVRECDHIRKRFGWALLLYLPCFATNFFILVFHLTMKDFMLEPWLNFVQLILVDIIPTVALVFTFRAHKKDELRETLVTEYKIGNESWSEKYSRIN